MKSKTSGETWKSNERLQLGSAHPTTEEQLLMNTNEVKISSCHEEQFRNPEGNLEWALKKRDEARKEFDDTIRKQELMKRRLD